MTTSGPHRLVRIGAPSPGAPLRTSIAVAVLAAGACALAPAEVRAQDPAAAAVLAERATVLYEAGDFSRAAALYREALALHDDANLHYNLARALQDLGEFRDARDHYVIYLGMSGDGPDRGRVQARIRTLDELIARAATPRARTPESEPVPARSVSAAPWFVLGVGAAALVTAIVCGWQFEEAVDAARAARNHADALPHVERAEDFAIAADTLFIAGGVAALAGFIWALVDLASAGSTDSEQATDAFDGRSLRVRF